MWQSVLNVIDTVESWVVLLPLYLQIPLLLVVLVPIAWLGAKAIDPVVEWVLEHLRYTDRPAPESVSKPGER